LLGENLDWDYLLEAATLHCVMPLMYRHLSRLGEGTVPPAVLGRLANEYQANARRNLTVTGELLRLVRLFKTNDIAVAPLKGPLLAATVYGDISLRQFGDLDVLLHEKDIARAKDLLIANGYRPAFDMTTAQEAATLRHHCEYLLVSDSSRVVVELHWRIIPTWFPFPLNGTQLLGRLTDASLGSVSAPSVTPEDLLLIICAHSTKHMWTKLAWICDVAEVLRASPDLDWVLLMRRARQLGGERMLFLGLRLAHDLLDAPLPEDILSRAADRNIDELVEQSRHLLFRSRPEGPVGASWPGYFERSRYYIRAMERTRDKLRYCIRFLTTPMEEDWDNLALPDALFPLYYVLRPFRVGRWFPRWVWQHLRGITPAV
ncbi:MAG TPA: nucleotidyltransferase family protein, partial [Dehalococcoidia bacterium]|nr:nucleotidyltransferase family protein [Dehalococcoidia bacterium]